MGKYEDQRRYPYVCLCSIYVILFQFFKTD